MTYVDEVVADAPVAWWRLGDRAAGSTAADETGNGSTGTYDAGAVDAASLLNSNTDHAVNAANGGVIVSTGAALQGLSGTALSIEAWVHFDTVSAGTAPASWDYVIEQVIGVSNSKYYLWWGTQSGTTGWVFGFSPSSGNFRDHRFAWTPTVDTTYHVVATADASNVRVYVNGVLIGTVAKGAGSIQAGGANARIGRYGGGTGGNFPGVLDEVAVYNTTLSPTRIQAHYDAGIAEPPASSSLVIAETLPALVDTLVLESYTPTLTANQAGGILIRGASIEPDEGPAVVPAPAAVSKAELRDKAIAYTQPTMVNGRPT